MQVALNYVVARRRLVLTVCPFLFLILSSRNVITRVPYVRSSSCLGSEEIQGGGTKYGTTIVTSVSNKPFAYRERHFASF